MRRWILLLAGMAGAVVVAVLTSTAARGSAAEGACAPRWHVVAHKGVPPLSDVVAFSPTDVWAVGGREGGATRPFVYQPVIVHWDGRRLQTVRFSLPAAEFTAVSATSPRDIWAVGSIHNNVPLAVLPLAVHYDGTRWKRIQLPPRNRAWLAGVTAVAPDDVWAVGGGGVGRRPLVMRWNGKRWRIVDMRGIAPYASDFRAIDAASARNVWAVGEAGLDAVATFGFYALVGHWDGHGWSRVTTPYLGDYVSWAVDISPSGDVWTVNSDYSGNGPTFVRWSGPTHSTTHVYEWDIFPILQDVRDVAAITPSDVWAVGKIVDGEPSRLDNSPLVGHWNGKSWRLQHTPFDTLQNNGGEDTNNGLEAIFSLSPHDIWAVGDHLIVRYSC